MPTNTPIQSIQIDSSTSNVTFSNIPQNFTDLRLVVSVNNVNATGSSDMQITLNNDTSSSYSDTTLSGNGTTVTTTRHSGSAPYYVTYDFAIPGQNGMSNFIFDFMNYSNSVINKAFVLRANNPSGYVKTNSFLWRNNSAITTIKFDAVTYSFAPGSTFNLYGISPLGASNPQASGGTEIFYDSSYVYHVYKTSGTFTPMRSLTADILVVAGGAGGGTAGGGAGGGGAGGLLVHTSQSLTQTSYTVTVGSGGIGGIYNTQRFGYSGNNSQFGSLTASVGGGGGGGWQGNPGVTGGSGGGGCANSTTAGAGAAGTAGQGFAGGNGTGGSASASFLAGGGGGGAGGAGGNGSGSGQTNTYVGGVGGVGSSTYSSWLSATSCGQNVGGTYYIAGGGAGATANSGVVGWGTGGYGGGGGGSSVTTLDGSSNTGGGGAADKLDPAGNPLGGNGGSGLVIVRYAR